MEKFAPKAIIITERVYDKIGKRWNNNRSWPLLHAGDTTTRLAGIFGPMKMPANLSTPPDFRTLSSTTDTFSDLLRRAQIEAHSIGVLSSPLSHNVARDQTSNEERQKNSEYKHVGTNTVEFISRTASQKNVNTTRNQGSPNNVQNGSGQVIRQ